MKYLLFLIISVIQSLTIYSQSNCTSPSGMALMDVNNVGLVVGPSGNVGFDLDNVQAGYEVPIGSNTYSIFAMSTWIGGITPDQQLKFAGQLYRQSGDSFWPGPLPSDGSLSINSDHCQYFDRIWEIYRSEVDLHREYFNRVEFDALNGTNTASDPPFENGYIIPDNILDWPGTNFDPNFETDLAPYIDLNGDDIYDPGNGDYPAFYYPDQGDPDLDYHLFGDKALWWIYNDIGNVHQELTADPLGVEFECTAYAFANAAGLEDIVYFRNKVSNRSLQTLSQTYIGQWVDGDLGCYQDDFLASHVQQSLGVTYNGDEEDEDCSGLMGYGANPPAVGTDLLKGPPADPLDGIDNNLNGEIDEDDEFWTMSKFTYFENSASPVNGNPNVGIDAYNLMRGFWNNGQQMTFGGDGTSISAEPCSFVFPGGSDPNHVGTNGNDPGFEWTEYGEANDPGDRRYIQSAGPFTFEPGESFNMHLALVWAQSENPNDPVSLEAIEESDALAQQVFDSEFEGLISGLGNPLVNNLCDYEIRNPSFGEVMINFNLNQNQSISLLNLHGQQVKSELKLGSQNLHYTDLTAGIYLLQVEEEGHTCIQKVIVH